MFKIIGDDQKEYGPVSAEMLRQWIAERRAVGSTRIQVEGSSEWRPLSEFPEFAAALAAVPPPVTAAAPPAAGTPALLALPAAPPKTSGLAIASLVCGVLGLCTAGITALVGLVLGIVALMKISKSEGKVGGNAFAIAGICVSAVFLLFIPILLGMFLPALAQAKSRAQTVMCVNNVKQQTLAMHMYASDHNTLPEGSKWCDALKPYLQGTTVFRCPADKPGARCSYAFNAKLGGKKLSEVNPQAVLLFESTAGWNASGGPELMVRRHGRIAVVAMADGSVQQLHDTSRLRWDP